MLNRLKSLFTAPAVPLAPARGTRGMAPLPPPPPVSEEERIDMATRCRDCDILAKDVRAGDVVIDDDGARVQVMHNGLRVAADGYCGAWMTRLIGRCRGHHEPQEERVFHEIVARMPAGATMIELGAWWSFYALWFLKDAPGRRAIALEPDPDRRAVGEANAARNGLVPRFVPGFVGATPAPSAAFALDDGRSIQVPRWTVPQLLGEARWESLDLLHCDAQGAELAVLESCAGLLQQGRIRTVVISTHHHSITGDPLTHQRCLALIEACGGVVIGEHDVHESFTGDGLIAARFGADAAGWPVVPLSLNRYSESLFRNPLFDLAELGR